MLFKRIVISLFIFVVSCTISFNIKETNDTSKKETLINIKKQLEGKWFFNYEETLKAILQSQNMKVDDSSETYQNFLKKLQSDVSYFNFIFYKIENENLLKWIIEYKIQGQEKKEEKIMGDVSDITNIQASNDITSMILILRSDMPNKKNNFEKIKITLTKSDLLKVEDIENSRFKTIYFFLEKEKRKENK